MQKYIIVLSLVALFSCKAEHTHKKIAGNEVKSEQKIVNDFVDAEAEELEKPVKDTLAERLLAFGLVDAQSINPNIFVELKYSTEDNFMKTNVYGNFNKVLLQKQAAEMLAKAQTYLSEKDSSLHLLVYDAVRPLWVQRLMWNMLDSIPVSRRSKFVSNPKNHSIHNYAAAVDLTICDGAGVTFDMGAGFDDPREIAYPSKENYYLAKGELAQQQVNNRLLLREVMKKAGFRVLPTEWWHFNAMSRDEAKKRYRVIH
jgi:D-alanyl-D-alanine dipeptidase